MLPDFGLGAGPETGEKTVAEAARCVSDEDREEEESLTSLLGILWEAELGQPAILAFLEQNWLEAPQRITTAEYFLKRVDVLHRLGLIDDDGCPNQPHTIVWNADR
ncbi:hypothetical protein WCLP8_1120001 [uncultured Gammaproteobacteria bacterium]